MDNEQTIEQWDTTELPLSELANEANAGTLTLPPISARTYFRPKTFAASIGVNPLVTAASALLALAGRLRTTDTYPDIDNLFQHLSHEVMAFEHVCQKQGYRSETILIARYVLCSTLDEIILTQAWGRTSGWDRNSLLMAFQRETSGAERFFIILKRLSDDPVLHLDLLELMYLCLSSGFEGQYRGQTNGYFELSTIIDNLYHLICTHREEFSTPLSLPSPQETPKKATVTTQVPTWVIGTVTLAFLVCIYFVFSYLLNLNLAPLQQTLLELKQANITSQ